MPFDARAAKLLQPGDHIILPEHPGLRLEATATRRSWTYRYKSPVDGGMRQLKLGGWPAMGYPQAVIEWEKLRAARDGGADPQLQKKTARRIEQAAKVEKVARIYTVGDLVDDYLTGHIDLRRKPKGRAEVRRLLTKNTASIAARPAAHLLRNEAYDLLAAMQDRPVLMGQVRQEMGAAYDFGLDSGKLPENTPNWWRMVFRGKMPQSKGKTINGERITGKRALSEKEIGQLINFLPNLSTLLGDLLTMYLWTGTRGAEIVAMQYGEITQEPTGWWWTIPKEKTKNARHANAADLRVPLIGRSLAIVLRRRALVESDPATMGYIFYSRGRLGHVEQKTIQSSLYLHQPYATKLREAKRSSVPVLPVTHWSPHDLRRTVRTLLASMGCPLDVAESVLGHMQGGIVGVYNRHSYDAERLEWLTKLDAKLESLVLQHAAS